METTTEAAPKAPETFKMDICAIMSAPRVGWTDAWGPIHGALHSVNMPIQIFTGGLWHAELEGAIVWCIEQGFEYVMTLDYDSMITPFHVQRLLTQMHRYPQYGALAALQPRRIDHKALFSVYGVDGDFQISMNEPLTVTTAHFGLTVLRLKDVQDIPKPWFEPKPDEEGGWKRGECLDADTSFWKKWAEAGKKLGVCADVRIGHLEMMVSYLDSQMKPGVCAVHEWHQRSGMATNGEVRGKVEPLRRHVHG